MVEISGATRAEKKIIKKVEKAVFKHFGQRDFFVTDVKITDGDTIRALNKSARGADSVTDVLSFPSFDKTPLHKREADFPPSEFDGGKVMLGSVMICRERAAEQAKEFGHSYRRETGFLICHGLLHLLGFDHIEKEDEKVMTAIQKEILDKIKLGRTAK